MRQSGKETLLVLTQAVLDKLSTIERYKTMDIDFLDKKLRIIDGPSFVSSYYEIFERRIYQFKAKDDKPTIIDCGANIGLSILFFKKLYPNAKVIAFEPSPEIYRILKHNLEIFGHHDVLLYNKALWSKETRLKFVNEGADSGRIAIIGDVENIIEVETVTLKDFIHGPIDFLKLDIEGAETEVIKSAKEVLGFIENIFIEYHSFLTMRQTIDILLKILIDSGFRLQIHQQYTSEHPFMDIKLHLNMDLQLNIFCFRNTFPKK